MNPITLPMAELKPALAGLAKGIQKHSTLPILAAVKIERTRDGWITLTSTNLDAFITVRLEQPTDEPPAIIVVAHDELLKVANRCGKDDAISIWTEERASEPSGVLKYPVGRQQIEQPCTVFPAKEFPETPRVAGEPIPLNDELRRNIHEAMACASEDMTRFILQGAYIDVSDPKCNQIVGTNGQHLYASNSFNLPLNESIVLPDHKFLGWKGFNTDGEWQMRVNGKESEKPFVQISSRRWRFISRQIEGNYPNWRQVVPTAFNSKVELTDLDAALQIVENIPYDTDNTHKPIRLKIDGRKFLVSGRNKTEDKWKDVEIEGAKASGNPIEICVNREFILKALKFGMDQIEFIDHLSPLKLSNGGKQMIVMPVRVKECEPSPIPACEPNPAPSPESKAEPTTERNNMENTNVIVPEPAPAKPALETAVEQLEALKEQVKGALININIVLGSLKTAQREQKVTEREYSSIKATLKSLQSVRI